MGEMNKYRCPLCNRKSFDRPYVPHRCKGGFRKKLPIFELIEKQTTQEDSK
jgi:hypothetical protein